MANIQPRYDRNGKLISFSIRVFRGRDANGDQLKPWTTTYEVSPNQKEDAARKKAQAFADQFEKECKAGIAADTRLRFDEYSKYVIDLKEANNQLKHSTVVRYKELSDRINAEIGHLKLKDIRADHLNTFYKKLGEKGTKRTTEKAVSNIDLPALLKNKKISRIKIATDTGLAPSTVNAAVRGEKVSSDSAKKICEALDIKFEKAFLMVIQDEALSAKSIIEHHRFISSVLEQAVKEGLVPVNVASKAIIPKVEKKKVNYFQPQEVVAIRDALESEPLKWKTLVHVFLITGARRGEILGLKWAAVDLVNNRIHIENNILYSVDRGIYEDTPKTEESIRWISLPKETIDLLKEWQKKQNADKEEKGEFYKDNDFVFCRDDGQAMHPDTVTDWMDKFAKRHKLPHINPHAFRHTMASMLYFNQVDSVSISKRLGHAQVSTTANIYSHVIAEADKQNADLLAGIFLKKA